MAARYLKTQPPNGMNAMQTITALEAISPVDGRYRAATATRLVDYFSEGALIRYRVRVEIEYFIALCELPLPQLLVAVDKDHFASPARPSTGNSGLADAQAVKDLEKTTNHDVKAVEYFLKEKFDAWA